MSSDIASKVDPSFAEYDRPDSPGCALGIAVDGQLVYRRGYGQACLEHGIPNSTRIVYDIASESKQLTAACIALLVEEGLLRLTDPIRCFVPEVPFNGDRISIDHLVHHTSGIPDYWDRAEAEGDGTRMITAHDEMAGACGGKGDGLPEGLANARMEAVSGRITVRWQANAPLLSQQRACECLEAW